MTVQSTPTAATPFPYKAMFVLSCIFLNETLSITYLFPFAPFMVRRFGYSDEESGYRVGFIASSFIFAQFFSSFFWGKLSDRVGRRPVLLFGMLATMVFTTAFGFSTNLAMAITVRALCGLLNGNVGVAKAYIADVTDESNQARAFSVLGLTWGCGLLLGAFLGGVLSLPTEKYPDAIPDGVIFNFLEAYPFILPSISVSLVSLTGLIIGFFHLKEPNTRKSKKSKTVVIELNEIDDSNNDNNNNNDNINDDNDDYDYDYDEETGTKGMLSETEIKASTIEETERKNKKKFKKNSIVKPKIWSINVIITICMYCLLKLFAIIVDETFPIWARLSIEDHGLGLNTSQISIPLSVSGVALVFYQFFGYHAVDKRLGTLNTFRMGTAISGPLIMLIPFSRMFYIDYPKYIFWITIIAIYIVRSFALTSSFTATNIMINNCAPPSHVGYINGFAQSLSALVAAFAPITGSVGFTYFASSDLPFPFDYHFMLMFAGFGLLTLCAMSFKITTEANKRRK